MGAPMQAADWIVCALAAVVMLAATWWVLYGPTLDDSTPRSVARDERRMTRRR